MPRTTTRLLSAGGLALGALAINTASQSAELDRAIAVLERAKTTPAHDAAGHVYSCRHASGGEGFEIAPTAKPPLQGLTLASFPVTLVACPSTSATTRAAAAHRAASNDSPIVRVADRREASPLGAAQRQRSLAPRAQAQQELDVEDELSERARITYETKMLFVGRPAEIDKLEAMLEGYRTQKTRTASGVWKLTRAYHAMRSRADKMPGARIEVPDWAEQDFAEWRRRYPASPSPYVFRAAMLGYQAIHALNDTMTRSGYPGGVAAIKKSLAETRQYLLDNKAIAAKDPYWYTLMLTLMRAEGQPVDAIIEVLLEGAERTPDYADPYFEVAYAIGQQSRQPFKDIEALAQTAVARSKDTLGDELYARIYWVALREIFDFDALRGVQWDWRKMTASMDTIAARYPDQWNIQTFALFSCMMQDQTAARAFMDKTRGRSNADVWGQFEVYEACRSWATADAGPLASETPSRKAHLAP